MVTVRLPVLWFVFVRFAFGFQESCPCIELCLPRGITAFRMQRSVPKQVPLERGKSVNWRHAAANNSM